MQLSLKTKIILPTIVIIILLVAVLTIYSTQNFSGFVHDLLADKMEVNVNGLKSHMKSCEYITKLAAYSTSANAYVIKAIKERDRNEIIRLLTPMLEFDRVDYFTVTDGNGIVLARTHDHDKYGDSVLDQQNVTDALEGKISTYYEEGTIVKVSVRTGSPVYDADGTIIGVVSAGVRFDTNESVDRLKEIFKAEFSCFYGDTRVATTIYSEGERVTGGKLSPEMAQFALENKNTFSGERIFLGRIYEAYFMPLLNARNEAFAVLFVGETNERQISNQREIINNIIFISSIGLILTAILLFLLTSSIVKPVKRMVDLISEVANGNINVDVETKNASSDEISVMINDVYSLIGIIKSLVNDLSRLTRKINIHGNMEITIDTSKYKGSYKEIIDSIKTMLDSILMMNKTMAVVDYLDTMISVVDFEHNLLYLNRSMADMYGVDRENCIGQKCYKVLRNLDRPCSICQLSKLLPDKDSRPIIDYEYLWDDVSNKWLGGRAAIIQWVDDGMVFFNSINDQTMRRKINEELQDALCEAQEANSAKGQFLANMSHEIRTPMNAIMGMLELLVSEKLSKNQLVYVTDMKTSTMALLSIINDILDVSKLQAGKLSLVPVHYDFCSLIDNVSAMAHFLVSDKNIAFKLEMDDHAPIYLFGDDVRLRQILMNLIGNAIKFTEDGYVSLSVKITDTHIYMAVTDTGIGIPEENISTLFNPFEQADTSRNRSLSLKGTGLGLTITKSIVEMMGGQISVESVYGQSTTFRVEIPKVPGDQKLTIKQLETGNSVNAPDAQILVVDDNSTNLNVACGLLRLCQITAETTTSGKKAIARVQEKQYDIVFMDYRMPEMNGIETTMHIRGLGITVPIIALTASAVAGAKEKMLEAGMNDYLSKPIDKMDLFKLLNKWLPSEKLLNPISESEKAVEVLDEKHIEFWSMIENIEEISVSAGLDRVDGQRSVYEKSLKLTIPEIIKTDIGLKMFLSNNDMSNFRIEVHGLKGALANIGAMEISEKAYELEIASGKGDAVFCEIHLPAFLEAINDLNLKMKEAFEILRATDDSMQIPPELPPVLRKLVNSFDDFDLMLIDKEIEKLNVLNLSGALKEEIEKIKDLIMIMDYDGAAEQIRNLLAE
jgi:signal transduction histidine kinase/response regulator of citrate/malate metabolism/HPt (histidine-containing phosphotransfer) domain-containing protein/HAMP domain-containing protein